MNIVVEIDKVVVQRSPSGERVATKSSLSTADIVMQLLLTRYQSFTTFAPYRIHVCFVVSTSLFIFHGAFYNHGGANGMLTFIDCYCRNVRNSEKVSFASRRMTKAMSDINCDFFFYQ